MRLHDETSAIIRKYRDDHAYWGASHSQHCTSEQALDDLDAILARHQAPTVSDGERETLIRLSYEFAKHNVFPNDQDCRCGQPGYGADHIVSAGLAAGYRKAPVVNVEDVARVIAPFIHSWDSNHDDGGGREQPECELHAEHIATAVLALFDVNGRPS